MSKENETPENQAQCAIQNVSNCTCDNDRRYCKGCYADVTKDMMCFCGEFALTKDMTLSQEQLDAMNV